MLSVDGSAPEKSADGDRGRVRQPKHNPDDEKRQGQGHGRMRHSVFERRRCSRGNTQGRGMVFLRWCRQIVLILICNNNTGGYPIPRFARGKDRGLIPGPDL